MENQKFLMNKQNEVLKKPTVELLHEDRLAMSHMKYAQGVGAALRYANELKAVQQEGHLPFLKSSKLHEDILRGRLGPGTGMAGCTEDIDESRPSRLSFL